MDIDIKNGSISMRHKGIHTDVSIHAKSDTATTTAIYWPKGERAVSGPYAAYVSLKTVIEEEAHKAPSDGPPAVVGEVHQYIDMEQVAALIAVLTETLEAHDQHQLEGWVADNGGTNADTKGN